MDRRTAALSGVALAGVALIALLISHSWSGDEFDLPEPPAVEVAEEPDRDPRVPPGLDLVLPADATVRYGESNSERATVLYTTEVPADVAMAHARDQLEARGWTVHQREGSSRPPMRWREAVDAVSGERPMGSAVVERGAAEITRVHLTLSLEGGAPFHAPDEPPAWRLVDRAPLPARPGGTRPECMQTLRRLCAELERAGGPSGNECAMDHRAACGFAEEPGYVQRALRDAELRLTAALRAHAVVGSRGARAQTLAQLRVELLGAFACLARATRFDGSSASLATLIAETRADGVTLEVDTSGWFEPSSDDSEIPSAATP